MVELLYTPIERCDESAGIFPDGNITDCQEYFDDEADDMKELSINVFIGVIGVICSSLFGNVLLFYGFGTATERMNKRVRDSTFESLVRQEVSWFDVRPVGVITSQISDDAAMIHSFSGEPIRTLVMNCASVLVGLVFAFYYMWYVSNTMLCHVGRRCDVVCGLAIYGAALPIPNAGLVMIFVAERAVGCSGVDLLAVPFKPHAPTMTAHSLTSNILVSFHSIVFSRPIVSERYPHTLLPLTLTNRPFALMTLAILPFMAFGAEAEMAMYLGEDEGDESAFDENSSGGIVVEALMNIRTVASLVVEKDRHEHYATALEHELPNEFAKNFVKGSTAGLGQFVQMWGMALMFWWGGWLLNNYSGTFELRDFLISMFTFLFSLSGLSFAMQGITDRVKANKAAERIFGLIDRESLIDPLSDEGKKLN
uniref:ABC transmembrane type-1 domain-containing protein n=1 Tax=Craspedostauros australis TaxID=1486917 RepID=A0A7R9WUT7_9STRA|mmetsp:Transcript_21808/g.60696  ORF Transcript_21808/g.60696 Transcript_21808/m.60696 type:complete len:424 (+) Transcript_21808:255-1526(+)